MQVLSPPGDAANGKRKLKSGTVTLDRRTPRSGIIDWGSARVKWPDAFCRSATMKPAGTMERSVQRGMTGMETFAPCPGIPMRQML
jgi:hypothetical protein